MNKGLQTIILPIGEEYYHEIINNSKSFKFYLEAQLSKHPEIFPADLLLSGYSLAGWSRSSNKQSISRRLIQIANKIYLVHPCFMMPYLRGKTINISKGLELRRYNVPYHAISRIKGKDAMFWYRAELALASNSLVGTTIKSPSKLPVHLALDEHHDKLNHKKVYIHTTVHEKKNKILKPN